MRERIGLGHVFIVGGVGRRPFLGKHHRHAIEMAQECGDGYATGLDGKHFVDPAAFKPPHELFGNLMDKFHVNLVVEKVVYFEDIALGHIALSSDLLFKEIHGVWQGED